MKKISSKEPITFRVNGTTVLEIDTKGCIADDTHAEIAQERLGEHIEVVEISPEEAVKEAKKLVQDSEDRVAKVLRDEITGGDKENNEPGLNSMKRSELDELAVSMGMDPAEYKNADDLREAIQAKK